mgnify:CR=1 FL=1
MIDDENREISKELINNINRRCISTMNIMEICGTHTSSIARFGIRSMLSEKVNLLSGPGCPVCVTSKNYIDMAIKVLDYKDVVIASFGDLVRVKGSIYNLIDQKENGKEVYIVYSPFDAVKLAEDNPTKQIVFLAVGFETTAPVIALSLKAVEERKIKNLSFLTSIKIMEPVMRRILNEKNNIDGIICPGHVASIKGADYFRFIPEEHNIPAVIAGFGELDIIGAVYFLAKMKTENNVKLKNLYKRCVKDKGNIIANSLIYEFFDISDSNWRGIGNIKNSSFVLKNRYSIYNAEERFELKGIDIKSESKFICSDVLMGKKNPLECIYFDSTCTPDNPCGPSMVSSEGVCSIYYKYRGIKVE